jgi:hypothetical protein
MGHDRSMDFGTRLFTLDAANAFIPSLIEVFSGVRRDLEAAQEVMEALEDSGHPVAQHLPLEEQRGGNDAPPEVLRRQREFLTLAKRVAAAVEGVRQMGIEVKSTDGLVDFRTRLHGEEVYLCWRFGEREIGHWHRLEAGFAGRQPIANKSEFEDDGLQ